jgi:hypothetical protein
VTPAPAPGRRGCHEGRRGTARHIPTRHNEKSDGTRSGPPRGQAKETASRNGGYPEESAGQTPTRRETAHGVGKGATRRPVGSGGYPDPRRRNPAVRATGGREDGPPAPPRPGDPSSGWPTRTAGEPDPPSATSQPAEHMRLALARLSACHRCHQRGGCSGGGSLTPRWRRASRTAIQPRTAEPWSCHSPAMRRSLRSSRRRRRVVIPSWCRQWRSAFVLARFLSLSGEASVLWAGPLQLTCET